MGYTRITPEQFVKAWQSSDRNKEVCEKLGMNPNAVANRAKKYRELGVNLKIFPGSRNDIDVESLNELCEQPEDEDA